MRLTSAYSRAAPVPKMPPGLVELMEGLTKDVLKNNPANVYEFCASHMKKLLELRDGPLPAKALSLEDKIAIAQEKVRQRARERQKHFDSQEQNDLKPIDAADPIQFQSDANLEENPLPSLRSPVHHDQDLSLSSEVEISHEPIDNNSPTSKDSNFDESDEIPVSKSSTFSSLSKSTVIDLIASTNHETDDKSEVQAGVEDVEVLKIETQETEQEIASETDKDHKILKEQVVEIPTIEINNGDPIEVFDDQNDKTNMEFISDKNDLLQVNTDFTVIQADTKDADSLNGFLDVKNQAPQVNNVMEEKTNLPPENEHEIELKSLDDVHAITEEDENMVIEIEPILDCDNGTELNVKVSSTDVVENTVTSKTFEAIINNTQDGLSENVDVVKTEICGTQNDENISDVTTSVEKVIEVSDSTPSKQTENTTESINASVVEINYQDNTVTEVTKDKNDEYASDKTPDVTEENIAKVSTEVNSSENTISDVSITANTNQDDSIVLKYTSDDQLLIDEIKKLEENASTSSTSLQKLSSFENNDDSSVMESDLSKTEDDIIQKSDNEKGQNNMDLETAAETIQKVFRSFLFKSRNSSFEDITNDDASILDDDNIKSKEEYYATANLNKERRPLGITRMDTVLQTVNEEKSLSLSTDDSSTLSSAATTIQAHVRGFLVRNRLNSYKTVSTNSTVNSNEILDADNDQLKNKTVLNIHIVPEEGNYLSRDESLITSMDLSLDESPPSSINLHPLSYDLVTERRKLLKREDAIQSVSPPSNNSGKLSEDSVKEILVNEHDATKVESTNEICELNSENKSPDTLVTDVTVVQNTSNKSETETPAELKRSLSPDESDVVIPFAASPLSLVDGFENNTKLMHSGEFHDVVLPTKVTRSDTTVVRGE